MNVSLRGYVPLLRSGRLVSATRVVLDGIWGDAPITELRQVGGFTRDGAFGGQYHGRGIRQFRFPGAVKLLAQTELRWSFWRFQILDVPFTLGGLGFFDVGSVAASWRVARDELGLLRWGTGAGLRLTWDTHFIIRLDVGVSPVEGFEPAVYLSLDNLF